MRQTPSNPTALYVGLNLFSVALLNLEIKIDGPTGCCSQSLLKLVETERSILERRQDYLIAISNSVAHRHNITVMEGGTDVLVSTDG